MFSTTSSPYYEPSGKAPITGVLTMILGGTVAAWILGILYVYAVEFIPIIYFNILATCGFGYGVGWVIKFLAKMGKVRSPLKVSITAFVVSMIGLWLHWAFFCAYIVHTMYSDEPALGTAYIEMLQSVATIKDVATEVLEKGHFSIGKGSQATVNGIVLGVMWLVEAGIIIAFTVFVPREAAKAPFSEALDTWAVKEKLPQDVSFFHDIAVLKSTLEAGDITPILNTPKAEAEPCAEITFHTVSGDDTCYYLSIANRTAVKDKKGKETVKKDEIITHLRITPQQHEQIRAQFATES